MFTLYEQDCQKLIDNYKILSKPREDRPEDLNLKWFPLLPGV